MKNVLLYANADNGLEARLQAALDLARLFDSHLACIQATPFDSFIMGDPFGGVYALPAVLEEVRRAEDGHRERIEARLRLEGIGWDWLRYDGAPAQVIADRARLTDLVVLSAPAEGAAYEGPVAMAANVALHSRAPVLAVAPNLRGFDGLGAAAVAWDGSPESSQALRLALPLLARAAAVHIVTVADDRTEFPAADASLYLARHGVESTLHEWPRDGRATAAALADAAASLGAKYLVMGAYGRTRLHEAVLGGTTRTLLAAAPLPLLLAH